jgi:hypothetical protein
MSWATGADFTAASRFTRGAMTYEVLVIIVAINVIVTLSLWRKVASKVKPRAQLKQESSHRALAEEGVAQ